MSNQNIYDNQAFFEGYYSLRNREDCLNNLLEQPAMADMLPDLTGKTVLDLGCGYGHNCIDFIHRGANKVVGIDLSQKMLEIAKKESLNEKIEYINMSMTDLSKLKKKFDFIYSSLAFHYIEDFEKLITDIYKLLNHGGELLYSQEHPIITATIGGGYWNKNEQGEKVSYTFSNYSQSGKREDFWFVDGVIKYHRSIGENLTTVAKSGLMIKEVVEPTPKAWAIDKLPTITKEFLKPNFLIVRAIKP